jgi:AraC-like DNA-binding protein
MSSSSFGAGTNGSKPLQQERISKILETIKSGRLCTLHGLAGEFNLSKSHLQHLFKRQTGLRLGHLIVEQKLRRAAHLLKNSNLRIKEIASAVGYEHASSFIRAFERRFVEAPHAYRHRRNRSKC